MKVAINKANYKDNKNQTAVPVCVSQLGEKLLRL